MRRKIIRLRLDEETVRHMDELATEGTSRNAVVVNSIHEAYLRLIERQAQQEATT